MRKLALIILDGWGIGEQKPNNAIHIAQTPFFDSIWNTYPKTILQASGEFVGLPQGQIGGSEVGHLTIGAGRVIYQELPRINRSLQNLDSNESILNIVNFKKLIDYSKKSQLHLIGQISPGGVHSHQEQLFRILEILKKNGCQSPYIHFISDGRDTSPHIGVETAKLLLSKIKELEFGKVVTLIGRYYAMDRDKNFDRTQRALDLYLEPHADTKHILHSDQTSEDIDLTHAFDHYYEKDITDEFIEPTLIDHSFKGIRNGEPIFFFNFRSDRMKQLVTKISGQLPASNIFTLTQYDKSYTFDIIFEKRSIDNTFGEILSKQNLTQLKSAETEKFPHVTYFFNGGVEVVFDGELRSLAPSNKVKHDLMPEMKADEIRTNILHHLEQHSPEFILVNFANPDMVGHTGNFKAVVKGVEKVDDELKRLCDFLTSKGYICCITADHGNADIMYDLVTQEPHTAHTLNPVPFIVYDPLYKSKLTLQLSQLPENGLSKIAGTLFDLMELQRPESFESLIEK